MPLNRIESSIARRGKVFKPSNGIQWYMVVRNFSLISIYPMKWMFFFISFIKLFYLILLLTPSICRIDPIYVFRKHNDSEWHYYLIEAECDHFSMKSLEISLFCRCNSDGKLCINLGLASTRVYPAVDSHCYSSNKTWCVLELHLANKAHLLRLFRWTPRVKVCSLGCVVSFDTPTRSFASQKAHLTVKPHNVGILSIISKSHANFYLPTA